MKLALITGAYGGLGSELSKYLITNSYNLILVGRDLGRLEKLKNECKNLNNNSNVLIFDSDFSFLENNIDLVNKILASVNSKIDLIINNAATHGKIGYANNLDINEVVKVFNVNFFTPWGLINGLFKVLDDRASVINISGGGGTSEREMFSAYSTSKTALIRLTENLASEFKDSKIRFNCIAPGVMKTKLLTEVIENKDLINNKDEIKKAQKALNNPSDFKSICDLVLFLASSEAKHINGKIISAKWDNWKEWTFDDFSKLGDDVFTLRRIIE